MRKKVLICLLAVLMVALLSGCGSNETQTSGGNSGSAENKGSSKNENKVDDVNSWLIGEWYLWEENKGEFDENPLTIEDTTCTGNGIVYNWVCKEAFIYISAGELEFVYEIKEQNGVKTLVAINDKTTYVKKEDMDKFSANAVNAVNVENTENNSNTEENNDGVKRDADGVIILTAEEMKQYLEKVEITTENWNKYIEEREETHTSTDAFGEVSSEYTIYILSIKKEYADSCVANDIVLKFDGCRTYGKFYDSKHNEIDGYFDSHFGELAAYYDINGNFIRNGDIPNDNEDMFIVSFNPQGVGGNGFSYMNFNCIKSTGEIIFVKIPSDVWTSVNNGEDFAVKWENADGSTVTLRQSEIISSNTYAKISKLFE